jgi:hypothetical protein
MYEKRGYKIDVSGDEMDELFRRELHILESQTEEYNTVKALHTMFQHGIEKPMAEKIFDTIPDHVFHDIKQPLIKQKELTKNPYNPFRKLPHEDFFDQVNHNDWHSR